MKFLVILLFFSTSYAAPNYPEMKIKCVSDTSSYTNVPGNIQLVELSAREKSIHLFRDVVIKSTYLSHQNKSITQVARAAELEAVEASSSSGYIRYMDFSEIADVATGEAYQPAGCSILMKIELATEFFNKFRTKINFKCGSGGSQVYPFDCVRGL